jgi:hypothetical protein
LFTWGHINEDEYAREMARLTVLRDELRGAAMVQPTVHIDGMDEAWAKGNPARRRQLLTVMFDRLIVKDGQIENYVARADRTSEVVGFQPLVLRIFREWPSQSGYPTPPASARTSWPDARGLR